MILRLSLSNLVYPLLESIGKSGRLKHWGFNNINSSGLEKYKKILVLFEVLPKMAILEFLEKKLTKKMNNLILLNIGFP